MRPFPYAGYSLVLESSWNDDGMHAANIDLLCRPEDHDI
jgi:hypothetical protein